MAKVPGFAKAIAGRWRIVEMDIRLRLRKRLSSSTPSESSDANAIRVLLHPRSQSIGRHDANIIAGPDIGWRNVNADQAGSEASGKVRTRAAGRCRALF